MRRKRSGCDSPKGYALLSAGKCRERRRGSASSAKRPPCSLANRPAQTLAADKCQPKTPIPPTPIQPSAHVLATWCPPCNPFHHYWCARTPCSSCACESERLTITAQPHRCHEQGRGNQQPDPQTGAAEEPSRSYLR